MNWALHCTLRLAEAERHLAELVETLVEDGQGQLAVVEEAQEFLKED